MGDSKISEAAVDVVAKAIADAIGHGMREKCEAAARAALEAAYPHLQGKAVPVTWRPMATCPRDGSVVLLRWGEDHVSPGWWSAPVSPVQNEDGTWPSETGGFPWAFFDRANRETIVNHAVDTEYGPTHWAPYTHPQPAALNEVSGNSGELPRLIAEWRAEADINERNELDADSVGHQNAATRHEMRAATLRGCANAVETALAATGKQQVGEVQESRPHRWNDVGERCLDCGDKDWMADPSCSGPRDASRHPVGHGVEWLSKDYARLAIFNSIQSIKFGNPTDDKLILENLREAGLWIGRYEAAQPAQGIDLGRFHELLGAAQMLRVISMLKDREDMPHWPDGWDWERIDSAIEKAQGFTMTDGRDAGTEVGNIRPPRDLRTKLGEA